VEGEPTTAPDNTDTDVTRVGVDHRLHRVVLTTALRDLTATSGFAVHDIRTGTRKFFVLQRLGTDRTLPGFDLSRGNGDRVRCAGVERRVDRAADVATVDIPRRCLGRPAWVRVGTGVVKFDETDTSTAFWADDALRDAQVRDSLALSPRVRRG
jgi:hypothetical protein